MIVAAVVIDLTGLHAEFVLAIEGNADRTGRTVARLAVTNRTETLIDGALADRSLGAISIMIAAVTDLGSASRSNQQEHEEKKQDVNREEEFLR